MRCRKCRSHKTSKNGIVRGCQRYRCLSCGFNFTKEHANGWPPSSKLLIVVSYCLGEKISDLAEESRATPASVFRWIEEARESITGDNGMASWVSDALMEAVSFKIRAEKKPVTEDEVYTLVIDQIAWLSTLFDQKRSSNGKFEPNFEALGWTNPSRNPTDAEFSELLIKRIREIQGNLNS